MNPWQVPYKGIDYPSSEHAYQAAKMTCEISRRSIAACAKPGHAKKMGRAVSERKGWEEMKLEVMKDIVICKFDNSTLLAAQLLTTDDRYLMEGNSHGDAFWGVCNGEGKNHLGRILMNVRKYIRAHRNSLLILKDPDVTKMPEK